MRACQSLVLLASMTALAACHKWVPMTGSPSEAITYGRPEEARLHLIDGERTQMRSPWIEADEVHGLDTYYDKQLRKRDTLVVALHEVVQVDERKSDGLGTVGFVLGLVVVGTVACPGGLMDGC